MPRTVLLGEPPDVVTAWLERRHALGQDGHDEVWKGEYHVAPLVSSRHGDVCAQLEELLGPRARQHGLRPVGAANIGYGRHDFRVPDLAFVRGRDHAVVLPTAAVVVEVVSPDDESRAKFDFYHAVWVDEVLIVDVGERTVEWHARSSKAFDRVGASALLGVDDATLYEELDWPPA